MASGFLAHWERLKKDFFAKAKAAPNLDVKTKTLLAAIAKPTGFTPLLKTFDEAMDKKHRKPAAEVLLKFYSVREPYAKLLGDLMKHRSTLHPDDPLMNDVADYSGNVKRLEIDMSAAVKRLQEAKGDAEAVKAMQMTLFETDLHKNVDGFKRKLKPLAAIEKKYNLLKAVDATVAQMAVYTKHAARTEAQPAHDALTAFVALATKCANACEAAAGKEASKDFKEAVEPFVKDLRRLCTARVADQVKAIAKYLQDRAAA